jgi:hypothetical protein
MSKQVPLIVILSILIVLVVQLTADYINDKDTAAKKHLAVSQSVPKPLPHAALSLYPFETLSGLNQDVSVTVLFDGRKVQASSIDFTLFYDPSMLTFVDLQPQGAFSGATVVQKYIHDRGGRCCRTKDTGQIAYELRLPNKKAVAAMGENTPVAKLTFHTRNANRWTEVRFLEAKVNSKNVADAYSLPGYSSVIKFPDVHSFDLK